MPAPPRIKAIYGGIREHPPGSLDGQLLAFAEELREEGVAIGTSEILDAFEALTHVAWSEQREFKEALAATLAKSSDDRRSRSRSELTTRVASSDSVARRNRAARS